jgi:hypothetical protein
MHAIFTTYELKSLLHSPASGLQFLRRIMQNGACHEKLKGFYFTLSLFIFFLTPPHPSAQKGNNERATKQCCHFLIFVLVLVLIGPFLVSIK